MRELIKAIDEIMANNKLDSTIQGQVFKAIVLDIKSMYMNGILNTEERLKAYQFILDNIKSL